MNRGTYYRSHMRLLITISRLSSDIASTLMSRTRCRWPDERGEIWPHHPVIRTSRPRSARSGWGRQGSLPPCLVLVQPAAICKHRLTAGLRQPRPTGARSLGRASCLLAHAKRKARWGGIGFPWLGGPARSEMYCAMAPKYLGLFGPMTSAAIDCVFEGVYPWCVLPPASCVPPLGLKSA